MKRLTQFFEGEGGILSMSRLLMFMAFFPSTYVLLKNQSALQWYLLAYGASYIGGKAADAYMSNNQPQGVGE